MSTQALAGGLIEMTLPDKPTSRLQQYRLTAAGRSERKTSNGRFMTPSGPAMASIRVACSATTTSRD